MLRLALSVLATILHGAMILPLAPLLAGMIATTQARLLGRRGPRITQPYWELRKLLLKIPMVPENASALYQVWPFVSLGSIVAAALLTPGFCFGMATARLSDFITFIGLLALARTANVLAGLETGFGFGGAGAGRAVLFGILADAALLIVVLALAWLARSPTVDGIGLGLRNGPLGLSVPLGFALAAMSAVALTENGRLPVDRSAGDSELDQVQKPLLLEYSGRYLGLFQYAARLRLALWLSLLGSVFCPFGMATAAAILTWPAGIILWLAKLTALALALAMFEVFGVKLRLVQVPAWLGTAILLGLLATTFLFIVQRFGA